MLDGAPLNVFADGLGAIQVRVDGVAAGLFYDPDENPAHAGLEIKEGETVYPLQDGFATAPGRVDVEPLDDRRRRRRHAHAAHRLHRRAEPAGQRGLHLHRRRDADRRPLRDHERLRRADLAARGRARRPLRRRQRQRQRRHLDRRAALRRRARRGERARLRPAGDHPLARATRRATSSSSSTTSRATGSTTRSTRRRPTTASASTWQLDNLAPGETRGIDVRWLLAAPAPPGTISPAAAGAPASSRRDGVIHARGRRAPAAGRGQVRQRQASARAASSTSPPEQEVRRAQGPGPDPGRHD